jgi:hypothetical protein
MSGTSTGLELTSDELQVDPRAASCRGSERRGGRRRVVAFYPFLLGQALLRWPRRLGQIDVYRCVEIGESDDAGAMLCNRRTRIAGGLLTATAC